MFEARMGKALLMASAIAGLAFIAAPSPGKAASPAFCTAYARNIANDYAGHRGLVGSALSLPLDVTGAVLTGRTTYGARWQHAYDHAYANCRAGRVAMVAPETRAFEAAPGIAIVPEEEAKPGCDVDKYNKWDPTRC
jgi:hypothetical protein